jgi:hypothetical protein
VNSTRVALLASALLGTLALAAAALAAPPGDGGAESGGVLALPVVPSEGGGSEPLPDPLAPQAPLPPTVAAPPVQVVPEAPQQASGELTLPLQGLGGATPAPIGDEPSGQGESSGGGFSFLASTGFGIASLVAALFRSAGG